MGTSLNGSCAEVGTSERSRALRLVAGTIQIKIDAVTMLDTV